MWPCKAMKNLRQYGFSYSIFEILWAVFSPSFSYIHWVTKKHIYLTPYVCNERIFDGLQFVLNNFFLKKTMGKNCSLLNNASFGTFCMPIGQLFKSQWVFKGSVKSVVWPLSKIDAKQEISRIFRDSLWLEQMTDLNAKGTKWSVIKWA